jgi:hypothetical protein
MDVPEASQIAKKWARVTPLRTEDYEAGVRAPKRDWATVTAAAEVNYEGGLQKSIARKAFGKGVKKAGTAKQQGNSILKGIPRFGEGVRTGEAAMANSMTDVVKVMKAVVLPPKYPKGDPRNYQRVSAVGDALFKMKTGA